MFLTKHLLIGKSIVMNSQEFMQVIASDQPLEESALASLKGLIGDYPYFQAAHILLVRASKTMGHEAFTRQLKESALVIPDKAHLLHLLTRAPIVNPSIQAVREALSPVEAPVAEETIVTAGPPEQLQEPQSASDELRQQIADTLERQEGDIKEGADQLSFNPVLGIITPEEISTENAAAEIHLKEIQPVKSLTGIIADDDEETGDDDEILTLEEETAVHVPPEIPFEPAKAPDPDEGEEEEEEEEEGEEEEEQEEEEETESTGSDRELLQLENEPDQIEFPGARVTDQRTQEMPMRPMEYMSPPAYYSKEQSFSGWLHEINQVNPEGLNQDNQAGSPGRNPKFELIDRFITNNPRIEVRDPYAQRLDDFSEKSVEEHESFLTDTLARIYIRQGLFSKALYVYEKLLLKYPEKSTYFAAQIMELKRKLNN
jgi:hypothetical protein